MTVCTGALVFVDELDSAGAGAGLDVAGASVCMMLPVEVTVFT